MSVWKRIRGWKKCPECNEYHKWTIFDDLCGQCGYEKTIEDILLNKIADEREDGPFIKVKLEDEE